MLKNIIAAIILSLGIGGAGFLIGHGFIGAHKPYRTVTVKGLAEKKVKADQGKWLIRYKVVNNDLSALYKDIETAEKEIKAFLMGQGFSVKEIAVQSQNITDNQSNAYNSNTNVPRYSADGALFVFTQKVDDIVSSSQKVGVLVKNGVVITGTSMQFRYTRLNDIKPDMLLKATHSAREAGETFAKQSESQLGPIKTANQGLFTIRDANSNYDSNNDITKKVRVVSTITFFLK